MEKSKKIIIGLVVFAVIGGVGAYFYFKKSDSSTGNDDDYEAAKKAALEAKIASELVDAQKAVASGIATAYQKAVATDKLNRTPEQNAIIATIGKGFDGSISY